MAQNGRQVHATPSNGAGGFTSKLRFELIDDEERALLGSYALASALGLAFVLLVQFGPRSPVIPAVVDRWEEIIVGDLGKVRPATLIPTTKDGGRGTIRARVASATSAITGAFGASGSPIVGQPTDILGKVALTPSGAASSGSGGKTVLAYGEGGAGSTPGRGGISTGRGAAGIGGEVRGGNVSRVASPVAGPPVVAVDPLPPLADAATLGTYVRGHESQLRFCYEENGLRANPNLAGSITVAITVAASGSVTDAKVAKRSWSGFGAAESETCILRAIRGWRLPASGNAQGTYSFPFNFSR